MGEGRGEKRGDMDPERCGYSYSTLVDVINICLLVSVSEVNEI